MNNELNHLNIDPELFKLIVAACDGIATAEQSAALKQRLEGDEGAVRLYMEYTNLHAQLQWAKRGVSELRDSDDLLDLLDHEKLMEEVESPEITIADQSRDDDRVHRKEVRQQRRDRFALHVPVRLVAVACLIILLIPFIVVMSMNMRGGKVNQPTMVEVPSKAVKTIATMVSAHEAKLVYNNEPKALIFTVGSGLPAGEYEITSGKVSIQFESGASATVVGPASFELYSAMLMVINLGEVAIIVPEEATGFAAITPQMEVVDLGTSFGLLVDEKGGSTELHVIQGEVEMQAANETADQVKQTLTTGKARKVDTTGQTAEIAYRGTHFLKIMMDDTHDVHQNRSYLAWIQHRQRMMEDSDMLLFVDFEEFVQGDEKVLNHASNEVECIRVGGFDVSGRFPKKRALAFQKREDAIEITIDQPLASFTLGCWVGFDEIGDSALLMSDGLGKSGRELRWQFDGNGDLRMSVMRRNGSSERYYAKGVITPSHFGRWIHLVTTFDGPSKKVKHYVNGQLVATHDVKNASPIEIGSATIGNWKNGNGHRRFVGRMDEMMILKRELSKHDVASLYATSMPYIK